MPTPKKKLYERYLSRLNPMLSSSLAGDLVKALDEGKTSVLRLSRYESSAFDTSWVSKIEDVLFDLGEIIKAPRTITKEEGSLVPVELAKKTNAESVQHLASHTQYVKNIEDDGSVVPSKVMSFANDDFLFTYENRFIATFIRRLVLFVEKRYAFIQAYLPLHKEEVLMVKTKAVINGEEVEIETKIKSKSVASDAEATDAALIAERIRSLREVIMFYYGSPFMKKMKNERDVRKPILMTNILRKNLKYHKCYEVFSFLERYDSLGINYKSQDTYSSLSEEQLHDLSVFNLGQYLALQDDNEYETIRLKGHNYKPKMLSSIDDEEFIFGPIVRGPIEFVRVDEEYRKYLDGKVRQDLPLHPKAAEKEYYYDEYGVKYEVKKEQKEIDRLLRRKSVEAKKFAKTVERLIAIREQEEALLAQLENEDRYNLEERILRKKRAEIVSSAFDDADKYVPEPLPETPTETGYDDGFTDQLEPSALAKPAPVSKETSATESQEEAKEQEETLPVDEEQPQEVSEPSEEPKETEGTSLADEPVEAKEEPAPVPAEPMQEEVAPGQEAQPVIESTDEPKEPKPIIERAKIRFRALRGKKEEPTPIKEEPVQEEDAAKQGGPMQEAPVQEEPKQEPTKEEKPLQKAPKKETPKKKQEKPETSKRPKPAQEAKAPKPKPQPKPEPKVEKTFPDTVFAVIPGRFIVKTPEGYYVSDGEFSKSKSKAMIFLDFNEAVIQKNRFGGKVVKL